MTLEISFKKFKTMRRRLLRKFIMERKEGSGQPLALKSSNLSMIVSLNKH